jgi:hypothetical protein
MRLTNVLRIDFHAIERWLVWNADLSAQQITSEWTRLTFGNDARVRYILRKYCARAQAIGPALSRYPVSALTIETQQSTSSGNLAYEQRVTISVSKDIRRGWRTSVYHVDGSFG